MYLRWPSTRPTILYSAVVVASRVSSHSHTTRAFLPALLPSSNCPCRPPFFSKDTALTTPTFIMFTALCSRAGLPALSARYIKESDPIFFLSLGWVICVSQQRLAGGKKLGVWCALFDALWRMSPIFKWLSRERGILWLDLKKWRAHQRYYRTAAKAYFDVAIRYKTLNLENVWI